MFALIVEWGCEGILLCFMGPFSPPKLNTVWFMDKENGNKPVVDAWTTQLSIEN